MNAAGIPIDGTLVNHFVPQFLAAFNQDQFFSSRPALDLNFPPEGGGFGGMGFLIKNFFYAKRSRETTALPLFMLPQTAIGIIGDSGVKPFTATL